MALKPGTRLGPYEILEPLGGLYSRPVPGSVPLFLLRAGRTGPLVLTPDPYRLCAGSAPGGALRPYDGKTTYVRLLGFAVPPAVTDRDTHSYVRLADIAPDRTFYRPEDVRQGLLIRALK